MPVSQGSSPIVRAFCSDVPCSNRGITILHPTNFFLLIQIKRVTIMVKIVTKLDREKYT